MRGLYRYETAPERWWACVEDADGGRVNFTQERYEARNIQPPFLELPLEDESQKAKRGG